MTTTSLHPRRLAVLAAAALAIPIAGCGSSDSASSGDTDPAKAIPAAAPVYFEATVRPSGEQRTDLEAALSKILRTDDPSGKIKQLIDQSAAKDGQSFEKDIEPWLGDKAAVAVTGVGAGDAQVAVVVNSTDDGKASDALSGDKDLSEKRSYEGVDYHYDPKEKSAAGVTKGFVIFGDEAAFKQVVDVLDKGADSLASNADLQKARDEVGGNPGFLFMEMQTLLRDVAGSAGSSLGPSELSAVNSLFKRFRAFGVGISANADAIRMNAVTLGEGEGTGNGPGSALPLDKAPGNAWLALTQKDVGKSIAGALSSLKGTSSGDQLEQFETATGLSLDKDVLSWMGDAGLFVEGGSVPALGGALVIESTDPAKTEATINKLKGLLRMFNQRPGPAPAGTSAGFTIRGAGRPIQVGLAGSKFVIAYGRRALRDAIHPSSTLASNSTFQGASGLLGSDAKPSFYLDWQTLTRFITLAAGGDASFAKAKPYLEAFTAVIGGGSGDRKAQIAIGLK